MPDIILPLCEVSEAQKIYQDQEHFEGAGDGDDGQDDCGWQEAKFWRLNEKKSKFMIYFVYCWILQIYWNDK